MALQGFQRVSGGQLWYLSAEIGGVRNGWDSSSSPVSGCRRFAVDPLLYVSRAVSVALHAGHDLTAVRGAGL